MTPREIALKCAEICAGYDADGNGLAARLASKRIRAYAATLPDEVSVFRNEPLGAIARGWCHPKNSHKEMDADLANAIADEVLAAAGREKP